ncbi:MAG: hypothetical protein VX541_05490 [Candidatus Poribacteria bacterium]|nr:hypothetical protein [Candidatus Poribacteria bacterium]
MVLAFQTDMTRVVTFRS